MSASETINAIAVANSSTSGSASATFTIKTGTTSNVVTVVPASATAAYPASTVTTITVNQVKGDTVNPTGTVKLYLDGTTLLTTLTISKSSNGTSTAYYNVTNVAAGKHTLSAVYSGDAMNPGGTSAAASYTVTPQAVTLSASCMSASIANGANYTCKVFTSPVNAGSPGTITYTLDSGTAVQVALASGTGSFTITKPAVGAHKVVIGYAAQGNYAAATALTESFTVTSK